MEQSKFTQAEDYGLQALDFYQNHKNHSLHKYAQTLELMGQIHDHLGRYQQAETYYQQALAQFKEYSLHGYSEALTQLAKLMLKVKEYE